jgi:hypothetical protein
MPTHLDRGRPMTTGYMECPQCGKRALSVATRCPHCGFNFPPRPINRAAEAPPLRRSVPGLAVAGGLLAAILLAAVLVRRSAPRPNPSDVPTARSDTAAAGAPSAAAPAAPGPAPVPANESLAPAPVPAASPATGGQQVRRYARTWVNIRGDRSRSAVSVGVLNPGDEVMVDSLIGGWYRVVDDGRLIGYVHRSTLTVAPAE